MQIVILDPERGIDRLEWDGVVMLRAYQVAMSEIPSLPKPVRTRLLKVFRDEHPGVMRLMRKGSYPPGYYVPATMLPDLRDFLLDPTRQAEANSSVTVSMGYGAGKRDALAAIPNEVILKTEILGHKFELTRSDMPLLSDVIAELNDEVLTLRATVEKNEARIEVIKKWAVDRIRDARALASAALGASPGVKPRISVRAATRRTEEWLAFPGFSKYEISSFGRVRYKSTGRVITAWNNCGHPSVSLMTDRLPGQAKQKHVNVPKTVAAVFMRPAYRKALHFRDGNRFNTDPENMLWLDLTDPRVSACDYLPSGRPPVGSAAEAATTERRVKRARLHQRPERLAA